MFGAFRTFGRMGAAAGRTIAQQIAAMFPSLWLEPSVTNGYQNSAGTTALTQPGAGSADPPVGLVLDLSQGAALGPELVADPSFDTPAAWTPQASWVVADGKASYTTGALEYVQAVTAPSFEAGKWYVIEFTLSGGTPLTNMAWMAFFNGNATVNFTGYFGLHNNGTYRRVIYVESATTGLRIYGNNASTSNWSMDNVSIRELKGSHALQSTSTARPKLSARVNLLVGTATLATQSVTVTAAAHTIDWSGAGTITASGAHSGALSKGQTFTPSAGTLTLTVSGSVTSASLVLGSSVGTYQAVTDANTYDYAGWPLIHVYDTVDDVMNVTFPSSLGSDCTVVTANRGTTPTILTGQTIGTSYTITATNAGRLVFPRALTAAETAIVTTWATKKGALPA